MRTELARKLRRRSTDAENKLWRHLRNRQIDGVKFRRQQPIWSYVVDFVSDEALLVIEIDGGQHAMNAAADETRSEWLKSHGYRVVRFWNNEVLANTTGVLEVIRRILGAAGD